MRKIPGSNGDLGALSLVSGGRIANWGKIKHLSATTATMIRSPRWSALQIVLPTLLATARD